MSQPSIAVFQAAKIALLATIITLTFPVRPASAQDINPVRSGWFRSIGGSAIHPLFPANENYAVGRDGDLFRNFFVFDLTGITGTITGATLILYNPIASPPDFFDGYRSPDATETYQLTSTTTTPAALQGMYPNGDPTGQAIYATLGTGTVYSTFVASSADNDTFIPMNFNAAGVAAINNAIGGLVGFGGQLTTVIGEDTQALFSGTDPTGGNGLNDTPPIVLRLTTTVSAAAPEPSGLCLLLPALVLIGVRARRH